MKTIIQIKFITWLIVLPVVLVAIWMHEPLVILAGSAILAFAWAHVRSLNKDLDNRHAQASAKLSHDRIDMILRLKSVLGRAREYISYNHHRNAILLLRDIDSVLYAVDGGRA